MNIITVDPGKYQTKALLDKRAIKYRTKIEEVENSISVNKVGYYIGWENKYYLLGDGASNVDYDTSKHKLQHKLAVYTSCSRLLENEAEKEVNLTVLCPLSMYSKKKTREEYRQFILNNGRADFELDGEEINLVINDVTIFGEQMGIPYANPALFKNKVVGVIELGGLNAGGVIMKNMKPVKGTDFTENLGSLIIMEKIRKELNKEILGANIQEYQMDYIIKNGYYSGNKELSSEIINTVLSDHFKEIKQITKSRNWDIQGLNIVVSGGGSLDLSINNIQKHISQAIMSNDPIWDNCKGGKIVGEMIYG